MVRQTGLLESIGIDRNIFSQAQDCWWTGKDRYLVHRAGTVVSVVIAKFRQTCRQIVTNIKI